MIALLAVGLAACRDRFPPIDPGGDNGTPPKLDGTKWCLRALVDSDGGTVAVAPTVGAWLEFDSVGNAAGFSGCNQFGATYVASGSTLSFGNLVATKRWCGASTGTVETRLLNGLRWAATCGGAAGRLEIRYDNPQGERGTLVFDSCTITGSGGNALPENLGDTIGLMYRQPKEITGEVLTLELTGVLENRCPIGATCIVAGDAEVSIDARLSGAMRGITLHTDHSRGPWVEKMGLYTIELVDLQPMPSLTYQVPLDHYVAFVLVTK